MHSPIVHRPVIAPARSSIVSPRTRDPLLCLWNAGKEDPLFLSYPFFVSKKSGCCIEEPVLEQAGRPGASIPITPEAFAVSQQVLETRPLPALASMVRASDDDRRLRAAFFPGFTWIYPEDFRAQAQELRDQPPEAREMWRLGFFAITKPASAHDWIEQLAGIEEFSIAWKTRHRLFNDAEKREPGPATRFEILDPAPKTVPQELPTGVSA